MRQVTIAAIVVLLLLSAPTALAWDRVLGCAVDVNGAPWGWGGTVICRERDTATVVGSGTLDTVGCFEIYINTTAQMLCTVNYDPGPSGDPLNSQCAVAADPDDTPFPWDCGTFDTSTGPNALSLTGFGAASMPVAAVAIGLVLMAGVAAARRRWG